MSKNHHDEILDYKSHERIWLDYQSVAEVFDPAKVQEISCILPMPDHSGVLIIAENEIFINRQNALSTLREFALAHNFPDYQTLSSVLKDIGYFGKYKLPWACPYFALCPLEGVTNSVWINPVKVENIYKLDGQHYAQLLNGVKLVIPVQRYYALLRMEIACGILAAIRQDIFHFSILGNRPLDYLSLPNTAFAQSLKKRPLLRTFVTRTFEIQRRYQRARFLHYYNELADNPKDLHWENWY